MPLDAAELAAMRDALIRARAKGTRAVRFADGREVTYASGAEMAAAISDLDRRIAQATAPRRGGAVTFSTSKGF